MVNSAKVGKLRLENFVINETDQELVSSKRMEEPTTKRLELPESSLSFELRPKLDYLRPPSA